MSEWKEVADQADLPVGSALSVEIGRDKIGLFNVEGTIYAIGDECTHADASLCKGLVEGTTVYCPWHGAAFDLKTGEKRSNPAPFGVPSYKVKIDAGKIFVESKR